jgi:hypothetical protein
MGSGMLPAGAYVTLEHEYILILRKGSKREFKTQKDKKNRRQSAIFWEERNLFFSDVWMDVKGTSQVIGNRASRLRSAAFPFEVAYRLINMYSVKGDWVLDPFLGTGTTLAAAMASGRNCIGYEIDENLTGAMGALIDGIVDFSNDYIENRLGRHIDFVATRMQTKGRLKYVNRHYGFPVVTAQEKELLINPVLKVQKVGSHWFQVSYSEAPQTGCRRDW